MKRLILSLMVLLTLSGCATVRENVLAFRQEYGIQSVTVWGAATSNDGGNFIHSAGTTSVRW